MARSNVRKVSLSLPSDLVRDIDFVAAALGLSRSAFISAYLRDAITPLVPLAHVVSTSGSSDAKRYRGESMEAINGLIDRLKGEIGTLQGDWVNEQD